MPYVPSATARDCPRACSPALLAPYAGWVDSPRYAPRHPSSTTWARLRVARDQRSQAQPPTAGHVRRADQVYAQPGSRHASGATPRTRCPYPPGGRRRPRRCSRARRVRQSRPGGIVDHRGDRRGVGEVRLDGHVPRGRAASPAPHSAALDGVPVVHRHPVPALRERQRDRGPDPTGPAGNKNSTPHLRDFTRGLRPGQRGRGAVYGGRRTSGQ